MYFVWRSSKHVLSTNVKSHFTHLDLTVRAPRAKHTLHRRLVLVVCVQSAYLRRCKGRSPYRHGWSGFMASPSGLTRASRKPFCEIFFSLHDKSKVEKVFLSISMFDSWPCSYWPICQPVKIAHVTVFRHNRGLYRVSVFIPKICDHEYMSRCTRVSCPSTPQLSSHP